MSPLALVGNHLWQSTAFALLLAAATLAFRRHRAGLRYGLWLAASIKFLVPFAALVALGSQLGLRSPAPLVRQEVTVFVEAAANPFSTAGSDINRVLSAIPPAGASDRDAAPGVSRAAWTVLPIWIAGSLAVFGRWWFRWRQVARIARAAAPIEAGQAHDLLRWIERTAGVTKPTAFVSCDAPLEPGVFGIVRPVLVWPHGIDARLSPDEMRGVLAHEVPHLRRRDNLAAAIHAIVEALFWFHPLVWWIGARLMDERERACDEEVVRSGSEPEAYAESILKVCRAYLAVPRACGAGVTGSNLASRVERIMKGCGVEPLARWVRLLLAILGAASIAAPIVAGAVAPPGPQRPRGERVIKRLTRLNLWVVLAGARSSLADAFPVARLEGQLISPAGQPLPQFEVASIKPNRSGDGKMAIQVQPGGRFTATNVSLQVLIRSAYRLDDFQIAGGPAWMGSDRFDIVAKAEQGDDAENSFRGDSSGKPSRRQLMLQALLGDRFKLEVHEETRELPIYALVVARGDRKLGPQLQRSPDAGDATRDDGRTPAAPGSGSPGGPSETRGRTSGIRRGPGNLTGNGMTLEQLASMLSMSVGRIVLDRTGLTGNFDVTLTWTPDQMMPRPMGAPEAPPVDPNGPSIFTAVQEQLGLKLDSQKGPVRVLVIDRAEHPTEN